MKRKLALAIGLLPVILLSGCAGGNGGGGVDIVKFLQNPWVMIPLALFIAFWMFKRSK